MKTIALILVAVSLSGCALFDWAYYNARNANACREPGFVRPCP